MICLPSIPPRCRLLFAKPNKASRSFLVPIVLTLATFPGWSRSQEAPREARDRMEEKQVLPLERSVELRRSEDRLPENERSFEARRDHARLERRELQEQLEHAEAAGREEEAERLRDRLAVLEERWLRQDRMPYEPGTGRAWEEVEIRRRAVNREAVERRRGEASDSMDRTYVRRLPTGEAERRLRHLRVAVENLRAAGLPGPAEDLERYMHRIEADLRNAGDRSQVRDNAPVWDRPGPPRDPFDAEGPRFWMEESRRRIIELDEQIEQLRRAIGSLEAQLRELQKSRN